MQALKSANNNLNQFIMYKNIREILKDLKDLSNTYTDTKVEALRKKLTLFLASEPEFSGSKTERFFLGRKHVSMYDAAYKTLLVLAELHPLNDVDPVTLDEIEPKNKIYTSTGHQFNIISIFAFHNRSILNSAELNKPIMNILTNLPFSERDISHIEKMARQRVNQLKIESRQQKLDENQDIECALLIGSVLLLCISPLYLLGDISRAPKIISAFVVASFVCYLASNSRSAQITVLEDVEEEPILKFLAHSQ